MIRGIAALAALALSACSPPGAVEPKADEAVAPTEAGQAGKAAPAG